MKITVVAVAALSLMVGAASAQTTLRVVSAFPEGTLQNEPLADFIDHVNETCTEVQLNYLGGPEAVPTFELGSAVRRGTVDVGYSSYAFYESVVPESAAIRLSTNSVEDQRENGAWEYLNDLHNERMNAQYLARLYDGVPFHLYLTREADPLDLSGLTVRIAPTYRAFFSDLGANVVQMPPGEVYTGLERGVVQGYGWTNLGIFDLGWSALTTHRVDPGFYVSDSNVLVNLDRWNALSDNGRDCLNEAALWIEDRNELLRDLGQAEIARQTEAGIQAIELEGEAREEFTTRAAETGWAELEQVSPDHAGRLRELMAPDNN